ncbi:hypothetical protein GALMADRAFT_227276 [Galerina marginata CBS 339.88]|uniref:Heterokaryon incompatibility domain-containing protein n=1 Tax=Galerina marginata (strain CBS 339.88) TaxID=685588 RepID=A0A067T7K4_GALM3|nr:hypothetical protein GALMADRAFT_227276 [Galerina marginata CBS 339.88]
MPFERWERLLEDGEDPNDWVSESDSDDSEVKDGESITVPPLSVPPSLAKPNDRLCDTCKALELSPRRFVVLPDDSDAKKIKPTDDDIKLGFVKDVKERSQTCPLCRLVLKALSNGDLPEVEGGEPIPVTMGWSADGPKKNHNSPFSRIPKIRILRPYAEPKNRQTFIDLTKMNIFPEITLLANDAPTPSKSFFARWMGDQIDFSMVRNWLAMCNAGHGDFCNRSEMLDHQISDPATEIPTFRLIDVVDNCIVHAPHNCKYVGLSYVWGGIDPSTILRLLKVNVADLETPSSLLRDEYWTKIPLTIRDAIQAVRELHLRYLWTDSLCIIQDDDDEQGSKYDAIAKMDLVYGAAYLTIVAATGTDAHAGLPGLHPGTRGITQQVEEIAPGFRLAFKSRVLDYVPNAAYMTRGWIFQEQMFSTRKLTFLGGKVEYTCRKTSGWREDVVIEDQYNQDHGIIDKQDKDPNDIGTLEGLISGYSARQLGFQSDIYNAFAGMIRHIKVTMQINLCHGIPDKFFDWFLLWKQSLQTRRKEAPSWSWSGWIGGSSTNIWSWYDRSIIHVRGAMRKRTWVIWYQRKAHDSTECVRVWTPNLISTSPSRSPRNFYGGRVKDRFPFDCTQTAPTPRTLFDAPTYVKDAYHPNPGSGFLQFWTVSAKYRVAEATREDNELKSASGSSARLGIFGKKAGEVGLVFVHPDWCKDLVPETHEFILICEGRDKEGKRRHGGDDEPGWRYMVMLIQWHGDWAERVGLGWIKKRYLTHALDGGPVWKEIILG